MTNPYHETKLNVVLFLMGVALLFVLLVNSFVGDHRRERQAEVTEPEHEYVIPIEVWQEFQNCIEPCPTDGVCDSCWKAIIIDKYHITNN